MLYFLLQLQIAAAAALSNPGTEKNIRGKSHKITGDKRTHGASEPTFYVTPVLLSLLLNEATLP